MSRDKILIIDGSSLLFRGFYALPLLTTKEGIYTNAMYGFLSMFYSALEEYKPQYLSVAFDKSGPTFRHEIYEEYKGTRSSAPDEIKGQFTRLKEILEAMDITILESDKYEADDIAGTLAKLGEEEGLEVLLLTGDRDYLQLADDNTKIILTKKGITETAIYDKDSIKEEYGLTPNQLKDLKALMGDSSDNIPGVPGIGIKTGISLIKKYDSLDGVYENIDKITAKKRKENLISNKELAYLSKKLGTIVCDIDLGLNIEDLRIKDVNVNKLVPLLEKYEFNNFLNKYIDGYREEEIIRDDYSYETVDDKNIKELIDLILKSKIFSYMFIIENDNVMEDDILYFAVKCEDSLTYILDMKNNLDLFNKYFKSIFEDASIKKVGHNTKDYIVLLFRLNIEIEGIFFDSMIAEYLIDPSKSNYSINDLSLKYYNYYGEDLESFLGKGKKKKTFAEADQSKVKDYICFKLDTSLNLIEKMKPVLEEQQMHDLFYEIEIPLLKVLADMQFEGFKVDKNELKNLDAEYSKEIDEISKNIHELAGSEFNINSPKQLGVVLFEDLKLPVIKKTKTGYSTNAEVLDKLKDKHPIINKVLRYRQIVKLKSTYIDGLLNLINEKTHRIHSTFNQTITTTGRISSTEPNLQNIPIKTHDGRRIRKAFIAEDNHKLVDADYSQIELRILAHISGDKIMIESFRNNEDIHTRTASQVFDIGVEDIDARLRDRAKAVNFGIIYGISDYGLSQDLNISREEAKSYIDSYLEKYPDIRDYMDKIVKIGKRDGYVETIFNRRRYIPELKSKNYNIRSFGERVALNTPIQGSAADIIKIAMVKIYNKLNEKNLKSKLILQVHDELIIEAKENELDQVEEILKETMETVIELKVPLLVDLKIGDSWYETM